MSRALHNFFLYVYAFSIPFEYWDPFGWVGALSVVKLIAVFYVLTSMFNRSYATKFTASKPFLIPLMCLGFLFVVMNVINILPLNSSYPIINQSFFQNVILFGLFANHFAFDDQQVYNSLFAFALGIVLLGVLFYFELGFVYRQNRLSIFGDNPNNQATKVAIGIVILILFFIKHKGIKIFAFLYLLPIPLLLDFLVQTASRGGLLTLVIGLALVICFVKTKYLVTRVIIFCFGGVAFYLLYEYMLSSELMLTRMTQFTTEGSLGGRELIWQDVYDIYLNAPLLGVGETGFAYEMARIYGVEKSAHNYFLYILVTTGAAGLVLYTVFLYRVFSSALALYKWSGEFVFLVLFCLVIFAMLRQGGTLGDKSYWFFLSMTAGAYGYTDFRRRVEKLIIFRESESVILH